MLRFRALPFALVVFGAAFAVAACGGDDDDGPAAERTVTAATGSTTTAAAGTPAAADLEALIATEVPGFTRSDARIIPAGATVTYKSNTKTAGGAVALVLVTYAPCDPFICRKLDAAEYDTPAKQQNLKLDLSQVHIENPALVFEFGPVTLAAGRTGLSTYAVSYVEKTDSSGTSRATALQYKAWYHDGTVFTTIQVFAREGASPRSQEDLAKLLTKAEGEAAAKAVFGAIVPLLK
ncbi:MAG: hypothetical protein AB7T37_05730 [Dehalococcoidia bacterium]